MSGLFQSGRIHEKTIYSTQRMKEGSVEKFEEPVSQSLTEIYVAYPS